MYKVLKHACFTFELLPWKQPQLGRLPHLEMLHGKLSPRLTGLPYLADQATCLGRSPHLSHLGRLPHLPRVPHLHVNRPLESQRHPRTERIQSAAENPWTWNPKICQQKWNLLNFPPFNGKYLNMENWCRKRRGGVWRIQYYVHVQNEYFWVTKYFLRAINFTINYVY